MAFASYEQVESFRAIDFPLHSLSIAVEITKESWGNLTRVVFKKVQGMYIQLSIDNQKE